MVRFSEIQQVPDFWNFSQEISGCFIMPKIPEISVGIQMKGPFQFLPTGIFGITSEGGPLISLGIFCPKFTIPFLTNWFLALIREFGKGIKNGKSHSNRLARFNRKMSFHFPRVFQLMSDRSVWHNGKHRLYHFTPFRKFRNFWSNGKCP